MSKAPLLPHLNKMKILGNKYKIGDEIGKGASGRVFKGLDIENGDFVAIKQVSLENVKNDDIKAIMQEIDLLKVLSHKNIVKYLGSLNTETDLHIILEYVENGSLDNIIKPNKFGPFPESLAAVYIAQVLEGLTYLHEQGVIHRDIKGANILATKEGLVKLTDFGVATKLTEAVVNTTHSSSSIAGTPYWMAPEVIVLSGACAASDIWSVGCTVIELLTCVPPYHDLAHYSALYHIVKDVMPPIPAQLSPEITDFLHQCFKKDAKQRPDARTLLLHPWIRNSARNLQSSVRQTGGSLRISQPRVSVDSESSFGDDDQSSGESHRDASDTELEQEAIGTMPDKDAQSDQDLAFSSHEKLSIRSSSDSPPSAGVEDPSDPERSNEHSSTIDHNEGMLSGEVSSLNSRKEGIIAGEYEGGGRSSLHPRMRRRSTRKTFDEKLNGECLFPLEDADFNKLLGSLKPDEPEDVILSACRKLIAFFDECPDEKTVFLHQHGLLPLMDLLEVPKNSVIPSVLQIINQIVKENAYFQEYACSLGLIPVVMNFAVPGCPKEVRTQAAYFLQQLCESRSSTLHMFIACRGIHVLVGFLEADYAKYREMVHLAVDGMWQILKLQCSTRRNDFCHIAAMNGILPRLVHTLHSLNEATRLAASSADGSSPAFSLAPEPYSIPQDPGQHISMQGETPDPCSGKIDSPEFMLGTSDHPLPARNMGVSRTSSSHSLQEVSVNSILQKHANKQQAGNSMSTDLIDNTCQEWKRSDSWKNNSSLAERHQGVASPAGGSIDKPQKQVSDGTPGVADSLASQHDKVRPLLIVLDKEPPSRRGSGKFEYMRQSSGLARLGNRPPLLHASAEWKTTNELDFLMAEFEENKKIRTPVMVSTSCNERVSSTFGVTPRATSAVLSGSGILNAIPGRNASSGLLSFDKDVSREYLEKVADLLLEFAQAGTKVKFRMCGISLVSCLFHMFQKLEPPILLKILKCINHLSTDANCLENLQRANAIKHLIPNLELREHPLAPQIHNEVLNALFNLCKINKVMQEQAANNGLVPHLMHFIMSGSPLKQYAVPMLCDMAHASGASREQLRAHDCLGVYLSLLDDELWSVMALDSLAACLAHDDDCKKVEQALLKKDAIQKLVKFFQCCPDQYFVNISEPFLKIITKSPRINTTLAVSGLTPFLMARLNHHDAIVRITLLKMIKVVYEHHPRPKQIIVENDMPRKLENLIKEQSRDGQRSGGQVLVKQLATALLKALHINTVL